MEKKIINLSALTIISSFPILLISGPFLSDLFCISLSLLFIILYSKYLSWKKFYLENKNYIFFFLSLFVYLNINSIFSFNPKISFLSSLPFIRICLFIFALSFFIYSDQRIYKYFYFIFLLAASVLLLDSLIQLIFDYNLFSKKEIHANRISSLFGDELIMGSYVSRILPIVLACSFFFNLKNKYLLNIGVLIISGCLITLSGERVAAFYYFGIFLVYFLVTRKYFIRFLIFISICLFTIYLVKPPTIDRFYKNTINQITQLNSVFSYRHTLHYKTAYDMFIDKKLIGHGLKSFRKICSMERYENKIKEKQLADSKNLIGEKKWKYVNEFKNGCNTHPHNVYFEYLAELGILGISFLVIIFTYTTIRLAFHTYRNIFSMKINEIDIGKILVLTGIFLQLFPFIPSGSYFNNWMMIIFHLSIGFYLSSLKLK